MAIDITDSITPTIDQTTATINHAHKFLNTEIITITEIIKDTIMKITSTKTDLIILMTIKPNVSIIKFAIIVAGWGILRGGVSN